MFFTFLGPPTHLFDDVILEWSLVMQLHTREIVHKTWNSWIDDHLSRRGRKVNFVMKFYTLFPKPFCGKGDQQYDIFFNIFSKS